MEKNQAEESHEMIFLQPSELSHEIQCDNKFNIEFYSHFRLTCIYTTVDSYCFSSFFTKTQFEPLITFTFSTTSESNETEPNKYFCFCSQSILAVVKLNEKRKNLICPLLDLMTKSFLNPTNPSDSAEFVNYTETELSNILYPFNLVNHDDTFLEINHFYDYFIQKLEFTPETNITEVSTLKSFLSISLKPALLFLLRRNYFPSTWFANDGFNPLKNFIGQISFQFADFLFLRNLYTHSSCRESLCLYKKSGTLFSLKTYNSDERFQYEKDVHIACQSRFIRRMYGYLKDQPNTLVLEFLSNGNGQDVLANDNLEAVMKSKIITETLLGIDTLNAHGYVLSSFNKKNVYFDRNFCAYISEFDSLHLFNDSIDTKTYLDQRIYFAQFLKDIGGPNFPSIDSGPIIQLFELCTTNRYEHNPTIYSIVYYLKTNHMYFSWSMKETMSQMFQELFNQQVMNDRKDIQILTQRANQNNDSDSDLILGLTYRFPQLNIQSAQLSFMYWMKGVFANPKINYQLALYFELMKIPEYYNIISSLANNGHILSQIYLAKDQINTERCLEWLLSASTQNLPESFYYLGTIYEEGKLVNRDINTAFQYYLKASEHFFHQANYRIGRLFYKGIGMRKNDEMAFSYLSISSLANVTDSNYYLSKLYLKQFHLLDINQSKPQMHKIYKILLNLLWNTAKSGNLKCQKLLSALSFDDNNYYLSQAASSSDDIYSIKKYASTRNDKEALVLLNKAAKLGDADSLYQIGKYYLEQNNPELGLLYLRESVRLNDPNAQLFLGTQYLLGKPKGCVTQNVVKGISLIQASANQNNPEAYEKMGQIFLENNYIPRKYDLALYYFDFAFRHKTANAAYYLGLMYEQGLGRDKDIEKAKRIYSNHSKSDINSIIRLSNLDENIELDKLPIQNSRINAELLRKTDINDNVNFVSFIIKEPPVEDDGDYSGLFKQACLIEKGMQPNIEGNPKQAFKLYKKCAIEGNNVDAMYELGRCYETGCGVHKDYAAAFRWYLTACYYKSDEDESYGDDFIFNDYSYYYQECQMVYFHDFDNHPDLKVLKKISANKNIKQSQINSFYKVGMLLYRGFGVPGRNITGAQFFLQLACEHNHADALCEHAYLLFECQYIEFCVDCAKKAANGGNPYSQLLLAYLYHEGLGVEKSIPKFELYIKEAIKMDLKEAQYFYGHHCENEINDFENAYKYFYKAAENGNKDGLFKLGQMLYEGSWSNKTDYSESIKFFKKIIDKKHRSAMSNYRKDFVHTQKQLKINNKKLFSSGIVHEDSDAVFVNDYLRKFNEFKVHENDFLDFNSYLKTNKIKIQTNNKTKKPKNKKIKTKKMVKYNKYNDPNICSNKLPFNLPMLSASSCNEQLASFYIGKMYSTGGYGIEMNKRKAANWFKISAEMGNSLSMYSYANMLEKEPKSVLGQEHDNTDHNLSYEWFSMAAKRGESKAFGKIMHMLALGMRRKKTNMSIQKLQNMIETKKDVDAIVDLADIFYFGGQAPNGSTYRDAEKALDLYHIAAEMHSRIAQYRLAIIYEAADKRKAAVLYEESAKGGYLPSMVLIADIYNKSKLYDRALHWYQQCSSLGLTHAKLIIGRMYSEGQGVERNNEKAAEYFKSAMEVGCADGLFECAKLQIEEPQPDFKKIMIMLSHAADRGSGDAMNMIGLMHLEGLGVTVNEYKASLWFQRGVDRGFTQAFLNLAKMNYEGYSLHDNTKKKDLQYAIDLFQRASKKGSLVAKLYLAKILRDGEGCTKDVTQAGQLYMEVAKIEGMASTDAGLEDLRLAMGCKNPVACNIIAERILQGLDNGSENEPLHEVPVRVDETMLKKAYSLFLIASKINITNALYQLGQLNENGLGTKKNMEKAISYYKAAAEEGCEIALKQLRAIAPDTKVKRIDDCPIVKTGNRPIKMHAYECLTCNIMNTHVICTKCALACHHDHELIDIGVRNNVFCCCNLCRDDLDT